MTDQRLALQAEGRARRQILVIAFVACAAALWIIAMAPAQARQQCSVAAGSQGYWSWRMIDGRKCWYQGKPMLSKSLLEWPARGSAQPDTDREVASVPSREPADPMDAQASVPDLPPTFDALWRARIEKY